MLMYSLGIDKYFMGILNIEMVFLFSFQTTFIYEVYYYWLLSLFVEFDDEH